MDRYPFQYLKLFWNHNDYKHIVSIDQLYKIYYDQAILTHKPINKYIFRTFIRKNGYRNDKKN